MEQRYERIKRLILERGCELITRMDYLDESVNIRKYSQYFLDSSIAGSTPTLRKT